MSAADLELQVGVRSVALLPMMWVLDSHGKHCPQTTSLRFCWQLWHSSMHFHLQQHLWWPNCWTRVWASGQAAAGAVSVLLLRFVAAAAAAAAAADDDDDDDDDAWVWVRGHDAVGMVVLLLPHSGAAGG
eukprot:363792-Pelagomonas_calceolata.AAC.3